MVIEFYDCEYCIPKSSAAAVNDYTTTSTNLYPPQAERRNKIDK